MLKHNLRKLSGQQREYVDRGVEQLLRSVNGRPQTRRELMKRGAALGLSGYGLAAALGAVGGPGMLQARGLAATLQEDPASGEYGGNLPRCHDR